MLFSILLLDKPGSAPLRAATKEAHRSFVIANASRMYLGGPLLAEDGATMIGSLIVVNCPDRAAAEAFLGEEPYFRAGLFETAIIRAFSPVILPKTLSDKPEA